jgi:hypothetical protein
MCFVHYGDAVGRGLVQRAALGAATAVAFSGIAAGGGAVGGMDVAASGTPDVVAGPGGEQVVDGFGRVLHNRWNRDLPPVAVVRPGEVIQLLCRDALDLGEAARTMSPEGTMTIDLGGVHPLTGPVEAEGAEPGDILEVEVLGQPAGGLRLRGHQPGPGPVRLAAAGTARPARLVERGLPVQRP